MITHYRTRTRTRGGAFPHKEQRLEAREFLAGRVLVPGLDAPELMQRVEDELDAMTIPERIMMEIDMRQAERDNFTADYEASAWQTK